MKKLILMAVLLGALPVASNAKTAAIPQKMKALKWPSFRQNTAKKATPEIQAIQFLLRSRGFYKAPIDGVFGAQTTKSVRTFQRKNGLKADGIVASQTFSRLIKPLKRGAKGDAVRALQTILRTSTGHEEQLLYADMKVDGVFGFETEQAVRNVQDEAGVGGEPVVIDGIVGVQAWQILFSGKI